MDKLVSMLNIKHRTSLEVGLQGRCARATSLRLRRARVRLEPRVTTFPNLGTLGRQATSRRHVIGTKACWSAMVKMLWSNYWLFPPTGHGYTPASHMLCILLSTPNPIDPGNSSDAEAVNVQSLLSPQCRHPDAERRVCAKFRMEGLVGVDTLPYCFITRTVGMRNRTVGWNSLGYSVRHI